MPDKPKRTPINMDKLAKIAMAEYRKSHICSRKEARQWWQRMSVKERLAILRA